LLEPKIPKPARVSRSCGCPRGVVMAYRRVSHLHDWLNWWFSNIQSRATREARSRKCACLLLPTRRECLNRSLKEQQCTAFQKFPLQKNSLVLKQLAL